MSEQSIKNVGISFEKVKSYLMEDENFRVEYEKLKPLYESLLIKSLRKENNVEQ